MTASCAVRHVEPRPLPAGSVFSSLAQAGGPGDRNYAVPDEAVEFARQADLSEDRRRVFTQGRCRASGDARRAG